MKSDEFIREVNEELQRDRLAGLWRRYGALVVAGAVLLVLGTAAAVGWQAWERSRAEAEAQRFAQAVAGAETDPAGAASRLAEFAAEGGGGTGYAALARLREAAARAAAGDQPGAAAALEALAANGGDPLLRDLGSLLAAARELETADPAALKARLEPLAAAGAPYRFTAREFLALLSLRQGDAAGARRALEELAKEAGLPDVQERRIGELIAALGGASPGASGGSGGSPGGGTPGS